MQVVENLSLDATPVRPPWVRSLLIGVAATCTVMAWRD